MRKQNKQMDFVGVYYPGDERKRTDRAHVLNASIAMDDKGRFTGRSSDDEFGEAEILQGRLKQEGDGFLTFKKKYDLKAQRRGAPKATILYQFIKTPLGGWFGRWTIKSKMGNGKGQATLTII